MYFIRVANPNYIQADIERGFSCYMGDFDLEDVAMQMGIDIDSDNWQEETLEEIEDSEWCEISEGLYRAWHHDGLSCHLIGETLDNLASVVAELGTGLGCGNTHQAMYGDIQWIASLDKMTHIFWASDYSEIC